MTMALREHAYGFGVFGTRVRLVVGYGDEAPLAVQLRSLAVQARLRQMHAALTRFEPDSELSCLNAAAGEAVEVSPILLRAVQAALEAARLTGGLVDPTLLGDLERAGYVASRAGLEPVALADALAAAPARRPGAPRPRAAWARIEVDPGRGTVRLPAATRLDLGGSAKGLAADLAAGMLAAAPTFAVDAGGDVRLGGAAGMPRPVDVVHPLTGVVAHRLELTTGAVATSGLRSRVWRTAGGFAHHLVDPATGEPAWTGVLQATALAPTAVEAEALAKAALLRGPDEGRLVLARHGGLIVLDDGTEVPVCLAPGAAGGAVAA